MNRYSLLVIASVLVAPPAAGQSTGTPSDVSADAEALESAAETIARMKAAMKQVVDKVEEARNAKDVVKLNCVNEKLTQVKALLKMSEQADIALHEAVSNRDPGAEAELAKIAIARTKVETLRAEADQCIGQLAYMVDEKTNVEVEQPSNLPSSGGDALALGVATRGDLLAQVTSGSILQDSTMTGSDSVLGAGPPPGPPPGVFPGPPPPPIGRPPPASPSGP